MATRKHIHQIDLDATPQRVFALLITPSAIRNWWSAARAIVVPGAGGIWAAAWGADEDDPDYVSAFHIKVFEPPRRLVFTDSIYLAKGGKIPFEADFVVEFTIEPRSGGCTLRVVQDGFPVESIADEFYAACAVGWRNTFAGIERFLAQEKVQGS